jgi:hypothetical protein
VFDTMVIPLDGSPFAADALPSGAALARDTGAGLRVVGIARSDAELALTYDHVHDDAKRAGLDAEDVDVFVDPDPVGVLLGVAGEGGNVLCPHRCLNARSPSSPRGDQLACEKMLATRCSAVS